MRLITHIIIVLYLTVTAAAIVFTMTRLRVPFIPQPLLYWSYGMMAPYQRRDTENQMLALEGMDEQGEWHTIALEPYFPFLRGERAVRGGLVLIRAEKNSALLEARYRALAQRILELEHERGAHHSAVRLWWERWPLSRQGYATLRQDPYIERTLITQFP